MSYIHEALIKAQKERHSHYPRNQVQVSGKVGLTAKTSWLTLTLLMMLISILIAIIIFSWFNALQKDQLHRIERIHQAKPVVVHPESSIVTSEPVVTSEKKNQKIFNNNGDHTEDSTQKKYQVAITKQPDIDKKKKIEIKSTERNMSDEIINNSSVEKNEPDDNLQRIIGPGQFLEISRLYERGLQYQVQKKYDAAIEYYQKCLKISPHMAPALNNMGVILLKKKEFQKAKTYFFTAIKESPDYVDPYYNLACLFSQINNSYQAIEYLKKAVHKSDEARNWAITDKDFEPLYELKEFNMIISGY